MSLYIAQDKIPNQLIMDKHIYWWFMAVVLHVSAQMQRTEYQMCDIVHQSDNWNACMDPEVVYMHISAKTRGSQKYTLVKYCYDTDGSGSILLKSGLVWGVSDLNEMRCTT